MPGTECAPDINQKCPLASLYASWCLTKSFYRTFSFGCGIKRKTNQEYKPHSRLLFSIHLQAILLLYFFILEIHSAILISGYRHQGACSLKVHNCSHSVCSYCYRMLCFGALDSAGQNSSVENHCLEHSLTRMLANDLVLDVALFFSLHARLRVTTLACQVYPSILPVLYSRVGVAQLWESRNFLTYMDYQPSKKKKSGLWYRE